MNVEQIVAHARDVFAKAEDIASLENAKARFLGKTGELSTLLKTLGALDIAARKREGARMNSWERAENIFRGIGFDIADGPEIETEWTNFTALNSPENHPARSMQDT